MLNNTRSRELEAKFRGTLIRPGDPQYEDARSVFNGMIDKRPALIARCAGAADVVKAVRFGRDHRLPLAVRGGGHSFPGLSVCDGGIVIDLSQMNQVLSVHNTQRAFDPATGEFTDAAD